MNVELFIAKRIIASRKHKNGLSSVINISVMGIALSVAVMLLSVAIVTGFQTSIRNKVVGFGSHITIMNHDTNLSYETKPVSTQQSFYPNLDTVQGIKHIQTFALKAGIIKTSSDIQGVILKGIGTDFDWTFFKQNIVAGKLFHLTDSTRSNQVLISQQLASLLKLKVDDKFFMYFIQKPPRVRKFTVSGIYNTGFEEFDKLFVLADIAHIQKLNKWEKDQVSGFEILIDSYEQLDEMEDLVFGIAGYKFDEDGTKLRVQTVREKNSAIFDWLELSNTNVWAILILMIIVAGFNMVSGLLILILERTTMIGILKAIGANNLNIRKIFLYNATYLILRGLFWGNLIGIGLAVLQSQFKIIGLDSASYYIDSVPINLQWWHILSLNFGTMFITILVLILPSMIISRISPVKAIRFN